MARLALVAALLLAAVPTLGRLAPQLMQVAHGAQAQLVALCTAEGLRYVELATPHVGAHRAVDHHAASQHADAAHATAGPHAAAAHHHSELPGAPPEAPHGHGAPDCAYCPLLLSLLVAGAGLLRLRTAAARALPPAWPASTPRAFTHPCGLGSRGPPRAGACLRA